MIPTQLPTWPFPRIIGHRGAAGHALENSSASFRVAAHVGHVARCDGVELDVRCSSDGEIVVHHDAVRPTGEAIATCSFARLRATPLQDGSPLLTLAEALSLLTTVDVYVEIKALPPELDVRLLDLLSPGSGVSRQVHAFDHRVIARLHRREPRLLLGVLSRSYPVDPIRQVTDAGARVLWQESALIDHELAVRCRAAGVTLIAWTANEPEEIARLVDLEVDGICSDWPDRVRAAKQNGPRIEGRPVG